MRPIADAIYKSLWGDDIKIERIEKLADYVLDRFFAIDLIITLKTGMILTGQEKFLSRQRSSFNSLTIEYYNDPLSDKKGDWFNLASQFYFCGYINKDFTGFEPYVIVYYPVIAIETLAGNIKWSANTNKHDNAKASFRYCSISDIPDNCIIARHP